MDVLTVPQSVVDAGACVVGFGLFGTGIGAGYDIGMKVLRGDMPSDSPMGLCTIYGAGVGIFAGVIVAAADAYFSGGTNSASIAHGSSSIIHSSLDIMALSLASGPLKSSLSGAKNKFNNLRNGVEAELFGHPLPKEGKVPSASMKNSFAPA